MTALAPRPAPARPLGWRGGVVPATVALGAAAAAAFVGLVDPNEAGHYPTCPFLWLTGAYCPGCGSLRAIHALAHGDPATALARNPLTVVCLAFLVFSWGAWLRRRVTGAQRRPAPAGVLWAFLAVVLLFWLLRNLPGFAWLAP